MSLLLKLVGAATNPVFVQDYRHTGSLTVTSWAPVTPMVVQGIVTSYGHNGSLTVNQWSYVASTAGSSVVDTPVNPGAGAIAITGYAPTVARTSSQSLIPGNGSLTLTGYAPAVARTANASLVPGAGALSITGYAPTVAQTSSASYGLVSEYRNIGSLSVSSWLNDGLGAPIGVVNPGAGSLTITGYAPTVTQAALPVGMFLDYRSQGSLKVNQWAYTVSTSVGIVSEYRNLGSLSATSWFADGISVPVSSPSLIPGAGSLTITGYAPSVSQSAAGSIVPGAGTLTLTGYAPSVAQSVNRAVTPGNGSLTITGFAPSIAHTTLNNVNPGAGSLTITGYAPTVVNSGVATNPTYSNEIELKRRFYVRRGKQVLLFNTARDADAYIEAQEIADKAIDDAQRTSRRARKRLRERVLSVSVDPIETVELPLLSAMVGRYAIPVDLPALIEQQAWDRVMQIQALAMQMQDDEDVELLLLTM